ncbi:MAG: sulfotransferase family 2 domain-containing protein [Rhodosalinus sp.]|uniref:sulfotransferase family 2 domain-containing protein n=1 Tax=Rhodosalinus sp. TaxID=2047741 RepID=UPI003979DBB6
MLIGVEKRFVFVANTKSASTTIEHAMMEHAEIHRAGSPKRKHIPLVEIYRAYDSLFGQPEHRPETYFAFGVMREPVDWILSWYRYRKGNDVQAPLSEDMTFARFWERNDWNITRPDGRRHLQRQIFCDSGDRVLADVIIPYHDLEAGFARICNALGLPDRLQRKNVSRIREIAEPIPPSLQAEMRAFYAPDYELFDSLPSLNADGFEKLRERATQAAR